MYRKVKKHVHTQMYTQAQAHIDTHTHTESKNYAKMLYHLGNGITVEFLF